MAKIEGKLSKILLKNMHFIFCGKIVCSKKSIYNLYDYIPKLDFVDIFITQNSYKRFRVSNTLSCYLLIYKFLQIIYATLCSQDWLIIISK